MTHPQDLNKPNVYSATLHRGWDVVRLEYELAGDAVRVREAHVFGGKSEKRVALTDLKRDARRVTARQPAYRYALILLQFSVLVLAGDLALATLATPPRETYKPVWMIAGAAILACLYVMLKTRRPREWTYFPGVGGGKGLYVLQDRAKPAEHKAFVEKVNERVGS